MKSVAVLIANGSEEMETAIEFALKIVELLLNRNAGEQVAEGLVV